MLRPVSPRRRRPRCRGEGGSSPASRSTHQPGTGTQPPNGLRLQEPSAACTGDPEAGEVQPRPVCRSRLRRRVLPSPRGTRWTAAGITTQFPPLILTEMLLPSGATDSTSASSPRCNYKRYSERDMLLHDRLRGKVGPSASPPGPRGPEQPSQNEYSMAREDSCRESMASTSRILRFPQSL